MRSGTRFSFAAAAIATLATACTVSDGDTAGNDTAASPPVAQQPAPAPVDTAPAPLPNADLQVEVDLSARKARVTRGSERIAEYGVAIGSGKWPTQTGEWTIGQVVWNPEWIPPQNESWTEDAERKEPGDPDNPLGRVQLVYDLPRTIHGTNNPSSIGKAVSHGSIRMRNENAVELAKAVMDAAGVGKDDAWYANVQKNRKEKVVVDLPRTIPIRVH